MTRVQDVLDSYLEFDVGLVGTRDLMGIFRRCYITKEGHILIQIQNPYFEGHRFSSSPAITYSIVFSTFSIVHTSWLLADGDGEGKWGS